MISNYIRKLSLVMIALALLLGSSAFFQALPSQAAAPAYGAGANTTGNPVGGGAGYSNTVSQSTARYVVSTKSQLLSALSSATSGQVVYVTDSAQIDLSGLDRINVPAGVTLASGRGQSGSSGALIYTNDTTQVYQLPLFRINDGSRVTGLRLRGPSGDIGSTSQKYLYSAVAVNSNADGEVDNCEIYNWPLSGVGSGGGAYAYVHHNYIHNCRRAGYGYGVAVCGGSALVEANLFNYNRHSVMAARGYPVSNYEARYNIFETGCNTAQSCDVHGGNDVYDASVPAGGTILIHHNTFKAIWNAVNVRGIPASRCAVYNNWAYHDPDDWDPYSVFMQSLNHLSGHKPYERMTVYDNWYGTTAPPGVSQNSAPATPSAPSGVASGVTSTQYQFQATTTDPDGDKLTYTFYWSDGSTSTTAAIESGATATASHSWQNTGTYKIYVRATDSQGVNSQWSSPLTVTIGTSSQTNAAPLKPSKPSGRTSGVTSVSYQYSATTTDPNGDKLSYTFYWSDGTTTTTSPVASGATAYCSHKWSKSGTYGVYVRATDSNGANSAWSSGLTVTIAAAVQSSSISNSAPIAPSTPNGTATADTSVQYQYSATTTDPNGDMVTYVFDWGDGTNDATAEMDSGATATVAHSWTQPGTYAVQVTATDSQGQPSDPSAALTVNVVTPAEPAPSQTPETSSADSAAPDAVNADTQQTDDSGAFTIPQDTEDTFVPPTNIPEGNLPVDPPAEVVVTPDAGSATEVLDNGNSPVPVTQQSGAGWCLIAVGVTVAAAVLLAGAIVRETVPKRSI